MIMPPSRSPPMLMCLVRLAGRAVNDPQTDIFRIWLIEKDAFPEGKTSSVWEWRRCLDEDIYDPSAKHITPHQNTYSGRQHAAHVSY